MQPIVTDMRKVLAKHPQVEQHRLHRRVFFDQIDPENQALMVSIFFSSTSPICLVLSARNDASVMCADLGVLLRENFSFRRILAG